MRSVPAETTAFKEKQQQEQQPIQLTSTITVSRNDLRTGEVQDLNKQLQTENEKLKEQLISLTSSSPSSPSSPSSTTLSSSSEHPNRDSTTIISPSRLFFKILV
ncbi:unnamed protein product [Rotaria sp. Silwood1]|nr:unnamed protein product [Rotaria sp. Silwood1]CAF1613856.1 unnamed protein product [Rotaria sp. Silwood1]CAF3730152.1 unnamed protein product [Rotaria sp. Silwood1]CAF3771169.1 unnamed protein product [Rotaria sp. Silwood1]CAF3793760.1 unnamed protein product [Rotaria sp. Silwood1]